MCCKLIPSLCMLLSIANAVHLEHYSTKEKHSQDLQPQGMQRQSMKSLRVGLQILQPQGIPPQGIPGIPPQGIPPQVIPPQTIPPYIGPQAPDKKCTGCIININCGGTECITQETPAPSIWTLPPTHSPTWTIAPTPTPKPTAPPPVTPGGCRLCPCYIPPPCQICQPCK
ncbi:unnamed protein product [Wuchereria bancrofti]|uniref:Uncharacterized protein n=1 Tax=Wuchereria bancrofti TaxID=6293 RepID=A0A3P7GJ43_WUCBA|nr:unnamed protein product [Wuchereria bancrofti]